MIKGLFGKRMPGPISGYGGGTFDLDGRQVTPVSMPQDMTMRDGANLSAPMPERSGGFFGKGGMGRTIAGTIGDALLQQSGLQPVFGPQMQFQQQMAFRQAEEQRRRAADLADFRTQMQIRQEFAEPEKPQAPRFEQDNAGNVWALDPMTGRPLGDRPVFVDQNERFINQNGAILRVPNRFATGAQPQGGQADAPDTLPADFFQGGTGGNVGGGFR